MTRPAKRYNADLSRWTKPPGGFVVLRYRDVEALAHNPRLAGVGLTIFDFLGVSAGPLRDWYSGLMFTNEGVAHHRLRHLVQKASRHGR